jgi:outer membrane protein insertion porin family
MHQRNNAIKGKPRSIAFCGIYPSIVLFLILISISFVNQQLFAQASKKKVKEIKVINNKIVSSATILSKLKMQEGLEFSEDILNEDLKRLYGLGFFENIAIDVEEQEDGFIVSFMVLEKPVVEAVSFEGNNAIKESKLRAEISIAEEDMLDRTKLNRDLTAIRKLYESKGFQLADVNYDIDLDESVNTAKVTFKISAKQRIKVQSIHFFGNYSTPDKELKKLMVTKIKFLFFIQPGYFKSEEFDADIERIAAYYRGNGYLDVKIDPQFEYSADGTEMYISINIDEGKQYLAGKVKIAGNERFALDEILEEIKMETYKPFSESLMREDIMSIKQYYYDRGYMDCNVESDMLLSPSTGDIDVSYSITEGEIIYIDKVKISGNVKTKDVVIRRELRAYPGEPFNGAEIRRSKERLYNLGYFEEVVFETEPGSTPQTKNLAVTVKETKTGEFSFGGGYSSVDKLVGFVQINQRNFDVLNFPTFTGGGQVLNVRTELGDIRQNYIVSWTDPWILGYPLLFGFDVYQTEHKKTRDIGYLFDEKRRGGDIRLGKEFTEYFRMDGMYKIEEIDVSDVPSTAAQAIRDEEGDNLLSRILVSSKYDTRNNAFIPTQGFIISSMMENTGGFLGGDKDFLRYGISGNKYFSFFDKKVVLELSGSLNFADSYGDTDKVPVYERYYAGGANTLRGYKERHVSPRDSLTNDPIGGNARFLSSAEATFPLVEKIIKGAVFIDAGEVWVDRSEVFTSNLKYGTGVGVRVKTPVGPVKLDYGWPLSDNHDDEKRGRFYFSMTHGF